MEFVDGGLSMTTVFTPPSSCSTAAWTYEPSRINFVKNGLLLQNAGYDIMSLCWPDGFTQVGRDFSAISQIYSPGWCPEGYSSVHLSDLPGTGSMTGVTEATCCMSDFTWLETDWNSAQTFDGCVSTYPKGSTTVIHTDGATSKTTITGPVTMWAQPIVVQFQSSDLSLFSTSTPVVAMTSSTPSASPGSKTISSPAVTQTNLATSTSSSGSASAGSTSADSTSADSSGLSSGASIGLGVGVGVGGAALVAALAMWFYRRSQKKRAASQIIHPVDGRMQQQGQQYYPHHFIPSEPSEVHASEIQWKPAELHA
ncbi:hypothetical protein N7468_002318 [Penicillium chermesinum]|uniref:Uncharacterized protein n=1 Tax=Penicillium chermesinum TaxID=63820 RepID=A0A9W9PIE4_9EURO|nr:uncharacterized protein N7468_002318 [Penicillium chermesinum]KAJ5247335.1 hypothetical protein N7468_002318 [Penicillium chermesinum]